MVYFLVKGDAEHATYIPEQSKLQHNTNCHIVQYNIEQKNFKNDQKMYSCQATVQSKYVIQCFSTRGSAFRHWYPRVPQD